VPPDQRVHEPDFSRRAVTDAAGREPAGDHHVEQHLGRLAQPPLPVVLQAPRSIDDLDAVSGGVGRGQRVRAQHQQGLGPEQLKQLLPSVDERWLGHVDVRQVLVELEQTLVARHAIGAKQ
jgi:hypothetical protein